LNHQVKEDEMGRPCSKQWENKNAYGMMVGKPEPTKKTGHRWEYNIKEDFGEIGWGGMDCIDLVKERDQWRAFVNTAMKLRVPKMVEISLSRRATFDF
jgi:hypothetical protein